MHTAGFAIAYVILRTLLLVLYGRAWRAVPEARPLVRFYGLGYGAGVAIWLVSLAFAPPARYVVWGIAQIVELFWQLTGRADGRQVEARVALAQSIGGLATNNWVTLLESRR